MTEAGPWPDHAVFGSDGLVIAGVPAQELSRRYGTPVLVVDENHLRDRARTFASLFPHPLYAVKAFTSRAVIRIVAEEGLDLLASTGGELEACLRAGLPGARVVLHGNNKSDDELRLAVRSGVRLVNVDNPVYYVQYGHARIASILRKAAERGVALGPIEEADLTLLTHEAELELLRALADVPAEIGRAAELRAPHRLTHAAQDLAARFHRFYTDCPVLSDDASLTQARLWLCWATRQVIANLLDLLGVSAPESMERADD